MDSNFVSYRKMSWLKCIFILLPFLFSITPSAETSNKNSKYDYPEKTKYVYLSEMSDANKPAVRKSFSVVNELIQLGPAGGSVNAMVIDPLHPEILYAATNSGVFKSVNSGGAWSHVSEYIHTDITNLLIATDNPSIIYAKSSISESHHNGDIFKSPDAGLSWQCISNDIPPVSSISIDPVNSEILYASVYPKEGATKFSLLKSIDSGKTWKVANSDFVANVYIMKIDPRSTNIIYFVNRAGIFKSFNSGAEWEMIDGSQNILSLYVSSANPSVLYAGKYEKILKSNNSGKSWKSISTGLTYDLRINGITEKPGSDEILFACTDKGIYKSSNSGGLWEKMENSLNNIPSTLIVSDNRDMDTLYAGTIENGIFKSFDQGSTWEKYSDGLNASNINAFAINPIDTNVFYAGAGDWGGIFKSTDRGLSWKQKNNGLTSLGIQSIVINPITPETLYVGTKNGKIFKSSDAGNNWIEISAGISSSAPVNLEIDPVSTSTIYASTLIWTVRMENNEFTNVSYDNFLYKSLNGGEEWSNLGKMPNSSMGTFLTTIKADSASTETLYCKIDYPHSNYSFMDSAITKIYKSINGGRTWRTLNNLSSSAKIIGIMPDPQHTETLYVASSKGIYKSINGGNEWEASTTQALWEYWSAAAVAFGEPDTLFAGTRNGNILMGRNGSMDELLFLNTWNNTVNQITIDPDNSDIIYLCVNGHGISRLHLTPPEIVTMPPTDISSISAVLNGKVTTQNITTNCYFEAILESDLNTNSEKPAVFSLKTEPVYLDGTENPQNFEQKFSKFKSDTNYLFRLAAENELGIYYGEWQDLKTKKGNGVCFINSLK